MFQVENFQIFLGITTLCNNILAYFELVLPLMKQQLDIHIMAECFVAWITKKNLDN